MSRARPWKARLVATALGIVALLVFGFVTHWKPLAWYRAWRLGYYVTWDPDGFVPASTSNRANHLARGGVVAGDIRGGTPDPRAATWKSRTGEIELIDSLPGTEGPASTASVSESGAFVAGTEQRSQAGLQRPRQLRLAPFVSGRAWLWSRPGGLVEIAWPGGSFITPLDVNDRGDVLLGAEVTLDPGPAFLVRSGNLVELPAMPGADRTHHETIDDRGWLLGRHRI